MQTPQPRIAVCLIRVERQSRGLVISVTISRDIATRRAESTVRFVEVAAAVAAVAEFLESFSDEEQP